MAPSKDLHGIVDSFYDGQLFNAAVGSGLGEADSIAVLQILERLSET